MTGPAQAIPQAATDFIAAHTTRSAAPLVPEITLHLATELTPIWQASEDWLRACNIEPPFWAFAWPGSQALARHVLDDAGSISGRRVLDFGAGCGLAAIACAHAGAALFDAAEIDPMAIAAITLNAAANRAAVHTLARDVVGEACRWDLILCGDVFYEAPMTRHVLPWLRAMARTAQVWVADPGRAYLPPTGLAEFASYDVLTTLELEDCTVRHVRLLRMAPE